MFQRLIDRMMYTSRTHINRCQAGLDGFINAINQYELHRIANFFGHILQIARITPG